MAVIKASPFGLGDQLTSVEMNILNDEIAHAVDGINGGSYTLTATLHFPSTAFSVDFGFVTFANSSFLQFGTGVAISGSPTWTGTLTMSGTIVNGTVTFGPNVVQGTNGSHYTLAGATSTFDFSAGAGLNATGGTWALAGTVINLTSSSSINVSGGSITIGAGQNLSVLGNVNIQSPSGVLSVAGTENVSGTLNIASGGTQHVQNGGGLVIDNLGTFNANAGASVTFASAVSFTGPSISISASTGVTLASRLAPTGSGHIGKRVVFGPSLDANVTFGINDGDMFHAVLTANRTFTVTTLGASLGDIIEISILGSGGPAGTKDATVNSSTTTFIALLSDTPGNVAYVKFYFNGSDWVQFKYIH